MSRILCSQLGMKHIWCRILSAYGPGDGAHTMVMSTIIKFLNGEDCDFTPVSRNGISSIMGILQMHFILQQKMAKTVRFIPWVQAKQRALRII